MKKLWKDLSVENFNIAVKFFSSATSGATLKKELNAVNNVALELPKNTLRTTLSSYKAKFEDAILEFLVHFFLNMNDFATTKHSITERGAVPCILSLGSPRLKKVNTMANLQDLKSELDEEAFFLQ